MSQPQVWTEVELHPEALTRLDGIAQVITEGTFATLPGVDATIIGRSQVDTAFLTQAGPNLKLVARHGAGFNNVDIPTATSQGILATNAPTGPTEPTAEHTVALMLALAKQVVKGDMHLRNNLPYTRATLRGTELFEQTLGIVGIGRIGRRVAEICGLGLKMQVIAHDPYLENPDAVPAGVEFVAELDELLSRADFVTLHTPLSTETHQFIGEHELRLMKPSAYLINASRGPVVDEAALIRALEERHLAGAGLDVFDPEPPEPDNPLLKMSNVVVTPHIAGNTIQGSKRTSHILMDQVIGVLQGKQPPFLLDPAAWPGRVKEA